MGYGTHLVVVRSAIVSQRWPLNFPDRWYKITFDLTFLFTPQELCGVCFLCTGNHNEQKCLWNHRLQIMSQSKQNGQTLLMECLAWANITLQYKKIQNTWRQEILLAFNVHEMRRFLAPLSFCHRLSSIVHHHPSSSSVCLSAITCLTSPHPFAFQTWLGCTLGGSLPGLFKWSRSSKFCVFLMNFGFTFWGNLQKYSSLKPTQSTSPASLNLAIGFREEDVLQIVFPSTSFQGYGSN